MKSNPEMETRRRYDIDSMKILTKSYDVESIKSIVKHTHTQSGNLLHPDLYPVVLTNLTIESNRQRRESGSGELSNSP